MHDTRLTRPAGHCVAGCLTRASLIKPTVNVYSKYSQKKRRNVLPFGTCKLTVHSTEIAQTIYGSIQEYCGFSRDEWLDGHPPGPRWRPGALGRDPT